jgi:hypothetical protein
VDAATVVEDLMAYVPLPPSGSRHWAAQGCLSFQPGGIAAFANVSAVRASPDSFDALADEAVEFFRERGRSDFLWFIGPASTPRGIEDALTARGASVVGRCTAMVLDHEPSAPPALDIRPVRTPEQLLACRRIGLAADGDGTVSVEQSAVLETTNDAAWRDFQSYEGRRRNFLAYLDDAAVAAAGLLFTDQGFAVLSGGATLPGARGRGCYHALVHARWLEAETAGAGPLAVQASDMSAPVLTRIGFATLASLTMIRQAIG